MNVRSLPPEYLERMKTLLEDEYDEFLRSYDLPRYHGLRVNTLKITPEAFAQISPFEMEKIPWIRDGYYIRQEDGAGRHPFYYAGLYYLQEPSAMTPAQILDVQPGDRVLDLCAAPGGKATALGAKLAGKGLLMANDISASRCRALLKNVEVFGIPNAVITNEVPARLGERFPGYFDKVLVDAPCSGEGMFRKDEAVARAWYPEKNGECARIQKDIIVRAADMLREGGCLLYSTCTFSPAENEEVIAHLLNARPEMRLIPAAAYEGFSAGIETSALSPEDASLCVRIWPHKMNGEGHFLALMRKESGCMGDSSGSITGSMGDSPGGSTGNIPGSIPGNGRDKKRRLQKNGRTGHEQNEPALLEDFCTGMGMTIPGWNRERLYRRNDQLYLAAVRDEELAGVTYVRNGLLLGECKKGRFEPSQALAMALNAMDPRHMIDLKPEDDRLIRYLRGESLNLPAEEAAEGGWKLITVCGFALGWGKLTGNILKNRYLAGWRAKS
ncbi:MAG: RsmB/NOP family class I SAM-dependent RNA methyltransferase [Lachnospiraceae bacterium]|nr:RsmB/NOP family class I SAM-dependent RNA methyltransferase [Lachnospiraceae bacterium]